MFEGRDRVDALTSAVADAATSRRPLQIVGGSTKSFYGRQPEGEILSVDGHHGITSYDPAELVVTVRSGTRLEELSSRLMRQRQMLPFEPPAFGRTATIGGTVACGFSGPGRPYRGALRDYVLGVTILNGRGERLRFGGQVIKNVAGYDVSRLMAGALGTLGVILDVSMKILPLPELERTLCFETTEPEALKRMNEVAGRPLPLSGTCYHDSVLRVRLSGTVEGVCAAAAELGGSEDESESDVWSTLREQRHEYFRSDMPLWRLSVPSVAGPLDLPGESLIEWGGALRWLYSELPPEQIRDAVQALGGHAMMFRGGDREGNVFHPLTPALHVLHTRLKSAFDPDRVLNPGRLYPDI